MQLNNGIHFKGITRSFQTVQYRGEEGETMTSEKILANQCMHVQGWYCQSKTCRNHYCPLNENEDEVALEEIKRSRG
jgi:hypothetical protein